MENKHECKKVLFPMMIEWAFASPFSLRLLKFHKSIHCQHSACTTRALFLGTSDFRTEKEPVPEAVQTAFIRLESRIFKLTIPVFCNILCRLLSRSIPWFQKELESGSKKRFVYLKKSLKCYLKNCIAKLSNTNYEYCVYRTGSALSKMW